MSSTDRKANYKLPPSSLRDKASAQELRRIKALEEQKRRRAQKIDESRQLDFFADLSIAENDEDVDEDGDNKEDRAKKSLAVASVAGYVALLQRSPIEDTQPVASTSDVRPDAHSPSSIVFDAPESSAGNKPRNRKNKSKSSHKRRADAARTRGNSNWADKCMYAELLEMSGDVSWDAADGEDGLPTDLETAWVAVGPVPVGKRCLAVTHNQAAGAAGSVPNTQLRSRLLGKSLISPFPSNLPPLTVLDCILDDKWRENGILHVLDVVTWKGQDVSSCEAGFRFWWRDTRLGELSTAPPASFRLVAPSKSNKPATNPAIVAPLQYPYPTTFLPVPYYTRTALTDLDVEIIPAAKSVREVEVVAPATSGPSLHIGQPFTFGSSVGPGASHHDSGASGMDVEPHTDSSGADAAAPFHFAPSHQMEVTRAQSLPSSPLTPRRVSVQPDGLLLYVAEAAYEPGTSPLSSWVPIHSYDTTDNQGMKDGCAIGTQPSETNKFSKEGPLDLFQRLVRRRIMGRAGMQIFGAAAKGGVGAPMGAYRSSVEAPTLSGIGAPDVDMMEF
ncbi:hypothetical protein D9619_010795 [Psilocybe cf. subviscida]|uniref:Snurportin-1 n=1 Tax=Psilocybe cf. subviscida TaxID=2480587 RepID=A0A8H5EZQ0_9AGAR|nr:hypothetical protein D9619_010795 [Psilocybe cf. subviscida]